MVVWMVDLMDLTRAGSKEKHLACLRAWMMVLMMDSTMVEKKVRPTAEMRADLMVGLKALTMDSRMALQRVQRRGHCSAL